MQKLTVIRPAHAHHAYEIAAQTFADLAKKVGDVEVTTITDYERDSLADDGSTLVLIGSDAANHYTADLYLSKAINGFGIRYCTDDYCIRTVEYQGRKILILAGGRPRSTIYAVYRYFERFCDCHWFWDGDRLNKTELPFSNIDLTEAPRFEYRGLRYFAHRSLHRFQAEHWSLDDWKMEIDWILKKRLNMFMLRIGLDDIFQKAFPEDVRYPERDKPLPEAGPGYNDRTLFWSLEYRGELRKQLLAYAFERDLIHPEDCGTMTHWYSRTPLDFLNNKKPKILPQVTKSYQEPTGLVWDVREDENLDNYFKLTDVHVAEYGKPEMFHTIGLGERMFSDDPEENKRMKLYVYRRIAANVKEKYPNAPLLIASWDLWMRFTPEEVQSLVAELDPSQSIILDYTSDTARPNNFTKWDIVKKFPWIFGIFSGYEPNSEIRGYYDLTNERLKIAKDDPMCKGLVLWPELSHGDTLITEYLALNAWETETLSIPEVTDKFCRERYSKKYQNLMSMFWRDFMPIVQLRAWSIDTTIGQSGNDIFPRITKRADFSLMTVAEARYRAALGDSYKHQALAASLLRRLAKIEEEDEFIRRDRYDIARTIIGRFVNIAILYAELLRVTGEKLDKIDPVLNQSLALMKLLAEVLGGHEDYSLLTSLKKLQSVTDTNPDFEDTLKRNAENDYCRAYIYENAQYLYVPEMELLFDHVRKAVVEGKTLDRPVLDAEAEKITENFYKIPLADMAKPSRPLSELVKEAADIIESITFEIK